ncbi:uncharacterized protein YndB with AHSA1/START domain [Caulobacter ginsengisoli]|uniref:Uncharacterized protein YndB with AHSA1/START domain n=1 Tax=Caulobacter ginsengisoli TaxID=400775 RepID=A0ABU0IZH1_9CAUL|nr:SRPBCC domain-containing protein [Caulobacter ginsengisoli]MDQ0466558.1 uncharacterized protein YndB with AHSA1/START domain [Caulobacter ginsengisoli]
MIRQAGLAFLGAALALLGAGPAAAEGSWRDFAGVSNTAYVEPNGDRAIQLSIDVPAPPQAVFDAFATAEGFKSWAVPFAQIDLRVGGMIESSYNPAAKPGDRDNIKNQILAYLPGRLLVIRNVQAPTDFPDPELFAKTVTIIALAPLDDGATRVTITHAGYGPGEGFDRLYKMFEWGDAYSLTGLRQRFVSGPKDWSKP